ncbi:MAG: cupredoxin domain-containing protein [Pseudomarimonas sp.]
MRDAKRNVLRGLLLGLLAGAGPGFAADVTGTIELVSGGKPLRANEAEDAVVYFRPKGMTTFQPPAERAVMTTRRKQFWPRILPIAMGSTVQFPNEDVILHNAFSASTGNVFDTGVYGAGEGATHTFTRPGLVKVYCNVHHSMFAHILVLDTPYFARPDAQGRFTLRNLPAGEGSLVVFHDRSTPTRQMLDPALQSEVTIRIELTTRKVPPHANKFGKPYGRPLDGKRY